MPVISVFKDRYRGDKYQLSISVVKDRYVQSISISVIDINIIYLNSHIMRDCAEFIIYCGQHSIFRKWLGPTLHVQEVRKVRDNRGQIMLSEKTSKTTCVGCNFTP